MKLENLYKTGTPIDIMLNSWAISIAKPIRE